MLKGSGVGVINAARTAMPTTANFHTRSNCPAVTTPSRERKAMIRGVSKLTPTQKIKRRVICEKYAEEIEELYEGEGLDVRRS